MLVDSLTDRLIHWNIVCIIHVYSVWPAYLGIVPKTSCPPVGVATTRVLAAALHRVSVTVRWSRYSAWVQQLRDIACCSPLPTDVSAFMYILQSRSHRCLPRLMDTWAKPSALHLQMFEALVTITVRLRFDDRSTSNHSRTAKTLLLLNISNKDCTLVKICVLKGHTAQGLLNEFHTIIATSSLLYKVLKILTRVGWHQGSTDIFASSVNIHLRWVEKLCMHIEVSFNKVLRLVPVVVCSS